MRVTSKGQVTIPLEIREKAGISPGAEVEFLESRGRIYLHKVKDAERGAVMVQQMAGRGTVHMSTDEILSLTRGDA